MRITLFGKNGTMPRSLTDNNRLLTNHPNLPAFIDPEKNGGLTADDVSSRSNKKLKWTCYAAGHTYTRTPDAATKKRIDGSYSRCPECIKLAFHAPCIAAQWHPTKNGRLTPNDVTHGSNKTVWWKCDSPNCSIAGGYEWEGKISDRTGSKSSGCQACSGKLLTDDNRLSMTHPKIAAQWHPAKNGDMTPDDVSHGSRKHGKVWWKCNNPECPEVGGHEWDEYISARTNMNSGCPACAGKVPTDRNRLTIHHSSVAAEWVKCLDCDKPADEHSYGSNHRAEWRCSECGHEWPAGISDRTISGKGRGTGCRVCAGKEVTDKNRLTNHPKIAAMVLPELNDGLMAYDIAESSNKRLIMKCVNGHEFKRSPNRMIQKRDDGTWHYRDCPDCNTVAFCYPDLMTEWNYGKNEGKTPYHYRKHSPKKVWWVCSKCGHGWLAQIASRTKQRLGCPACSGHVVSDKNRLTKIRPWVANEWVRCLDCGGQVDEHPFGSSHRGQWQCGSGHIWDAIISSRSAGNGCPKCHPHRSKREIRIACELAYLFPDISPIDTVRLDPEDRRKLICDIYSPANNLVIEYDGSYWHENEEKAEADIEKNRRLEFLGYNVLHLREDPLEPLSNAHNILCNADYYRTDAGIKAVVNDVLRYIAREFGISNSNTKDYLAREGLANAELAETIIANDGERQLPLLM